MMLFLKGVEISLNETLFNHRKRRELRVAYENWRIELLILTFSWRKSKAAE